MTDDICEFCQNKKYYLLTSQDFSHGVVGLAYIANKHFTIGGICSMPRGFSRKMYQNCGLTSYVNWAHTLTTLEATLVTAHEFGHNFGANHDQGEKKWTWSDSIGMGFSLFWGRDDTAIIL